MVREEAAVHTEGPADEETYLTLLDRARRKTGSIPPELLVRHVLEVTRDADWPVKREAMEAVIRRVAFGRADGLGIARRPAGGSALGPYLTRRRGDGARPYRTMLESVDPIRGSCDCPDFLRNSLALCKHLLSAVQDVASKPRLFRSAAEASASGGVKAGGPVRWDPLRPLTGRGDWLERVEWTEGAPPERTRRWFRKQSDRRWRVRETFRSEPRRRMDLCVALLEHLGRRKRVDPALETLLKEERSRLRRSLEDAGAADRARRTLRTLKQKLFPYQRQAVERFLATGRLLLADDMGLGKTAQAIAVCHALFESGRVRRGLLLVPASLKPQWVREWRAFTDAPVAVVEGAPDDRRKAFERCRSGFLIANYEQLIRDLDVMKGWEPELVILDEAQRIKNWATKTAHYVKRLSPPYRLVLTGTPMENRLDELASIVEWVDDHALEPKWRLVPWHMAPADGRQEVGGARNLDTLRCRLEDCMIRRLRQDVLRQLPSRTDTRVPVAMTDEQREEHDALLKPILALVNIMKRRPLTQAEHLRLMMLLTTQRIISNGLAQFRFEEVWPQVSRIGRPSETVIKGLSSPKLLELREVVARVAVEQRRKLVIFSQWRRMLRLADWAVRDVLADAGLRSAFFTGQERPKRRTQNIVEFHDDPAVSILFATDAGGVGLNLQHAASACVNLELPWNPAVLEQRIGRIYRLGQKRPINVYNLVTEEGIEARIADLVGTKQALFKGLFDGTSDQVVFERAGSFAARVEKLLGPLAKEAGREDLGGDGGGEGDAASEGALERMVAAADESADGPSEEPPAAPEPPTPDQVRELFSGVRLRPKKDGGIVIDAPPQAAATLAALFEGMAGMLRHAK